MRTLPGIQSTPVLGRIGEEEIVPSIDHRFWRPGRGWAMARDLKPGDEIRTLSDIIPVGSVTPSEVQKVDNLVASSHSFFVGQGGALVHDNTLPAVRAERFDVADELKTVAADDRLGERSR